jgi:hypothetical protein
MKQLQWNPMSFAYPRREALLNEMIGRDQHDQRLIHSWVFASAVIDTETRCLCL